MARRWLCLLTSRSHHVFCFTFVRPFRSSPVAAQGKIDIYRRLGGSSVVIDEAAVDCTQEVRGRTSPQQQRGIVWFGLVWLTAPQMFDDFVMLCSLPLPWFMCTSLVGLLAASWLAGSLAVCPSLHLSLFLLLSICALLHHFVYLPLCLSVSPSLSVHVTLSLPVVGGLRIKNTQKRVLALPKSRNKCRCVQTQ